MCTSWPNPRYVVWYGCELDIAAFKPFDHTGTPDDLETSFSLSEHKLCALNAPIAYREKIK